MKATVVVSCYNQKDYISECLESILNQKTDFDFNILISDDCSTDGTREIVAKFQAQYSEKINIILRGKNVGAAVNYIEAHKAADNEIVFHFDGDDVMLPGKLQKQFILFREQPSLNLVFHRAMYFSDDGSYTANTGSPPGADKEITYFNAKDLALWGSITVHSAYAYRKSSRKVSDPGREFMEWFFAMDSLLPHGQGAYLDEILVKYRCNVAGGAYLATKKGRARAYTIYFNDVLHYFEAQPALRKELYSNCLLTTLAMMKSGCGYSKKITFFLLRKFYHFSLSNFKKTMQMRTSVAPSKRVR